jgi:hypothetical protein
MPFFNTDKKIQADAKKLYELLSNDKAFLAYEDLIDQLGTEELVGKKSQIAKQVVTEFIKKYDVNASNNHALTILHHLILLEQYALVPLVLESDAFKKINFKTHLPHGFNLYASALDFAVSTLTKENFDEVLTLIESLLQHGALPPRPDKKFIASELYEYLIPNIFEIDGSRPSRDQTATLLTLLVAYDFDLEKMKIEFNTRLFDETSDKWGRISNSKWKEYNKEFGLNKETQKERLESFIEMLNTKIAHNPYQKDLKVELTPERLDNGENTLRLEYDPTDTPCCVM